MTARFPSEASRSTSAAPKGYECWLHDTPSEDVSRLVGVPPGPSPPPIATTPSAVGTMWLLIGAFSPLCQSTPSFECQNQSCGEEISGAPSPTNSPCA